MASPFVVFRLEVEDVQPLIWRVLRVPGDLRLAQLHAVLQKVLGWTDRHSHSFEIRGRSVADLTISETFAAAASGFTYLYDDRIGWRVRITRAPGIWRAMSKAQIACLDGYLAGPRDDSGGPRAYSAILAATLGRGPRLSSAEMARLGPNFDPEAFDRTKINRELAQFSR